MTDADTRIEASSQHRERMLLAGSWIPSEQEESMPRKSGQATGKGPGGRGAREPSNPSGERKQGGRKASRKSTLTGSGKTERKRAGSESGGRKKKGRGGGAGKSRGPAKW
jgi:hypothetical protein